MDLNNIAQASVSPQDVQKNLTEWLGGAPKPPLPLCPVPGSQAVLASPFRHFWDLGFKRLVPILPLDVTISPNSTLARRPARGKAVGVRGNDGNWFGFDWVKYETDEHDLDRWSRMNAGVGIKTGRQTDGTWLVAIDADTLNPEIAHEIERVVRKHFGDVPTRIGKAPKALYVVRLCSDFVYSRDEFDDGVSFDRDGNAAARVEFLSDGRQFVAFGIHPDTRRPYEWTVPLSRFEDLPVLDVEHLS